METKSYKANKTVCTSESKRRTMELNELENDIEVYNLYIGIKHQNNVLIILAHFYGTLLKLYKHLHASKLV